MQLTITKQEWMKDGQFPENCDWKSATKLRFKSYVAIADFLDKNPQLKNRVMLVKSPYQVMGNKVIFDGIDTFIEGRGHI